MGIGGGASSWRPYLKLDAISKFEWSGSNLMALSDSERIGEIEGTQRTWNQLEVNLSSYVFLWTALFKFLILSPSYMRLKFRVTLSHLIWIFGMNWKYKLFTLANICSQIHLDVHLIMVNCFPLKAKKYH